MFRVRNKFLRVFDALEHSMVRRIIVVRHGQSEADVNLAEYCRQADFRIKLTPQGEAEARKVGATIKTLIPENESVYFYWSPFIRSRQSLQNVQEAMELPTHRNLGGREDPRLRPCDKGQHQEVTELMKAIHERAKFGRFFYRYAQGESGADVHDRVSSFLDSFHREKRLFTAPTAVIVITHGLTMRLFAMKLFNLTVESFEKMKSLPHGSLMHLRRVDALGSEDPLERFVLDEKTMKALNIPTSLTGHQEYSGRNKDVLGSTSLGAPFL